MALLTSHALIVRNELPGWAFMWLMAWAIFFGCKFATWQRAWRPGARPAVGRSLGYLFAWPGMDAAAFLTQTERGHSCPQQVGLDNEASTNSKPWRVLGLLRTGMSALRSSATASILGGAIPIWVAARYGQGIQPLARGWVAMIGIVLFLHFGLFQLLALAWRRAGVNATPLMCRPLASTSLADFWSGRWNTAFNAVARDLVFRPLAPRLGGTAALIVVFLVSGLVHEAVISLPARAGYGLPTAYFALQAMGVALERNACGRRLGLGHGIRGWSFVMVCAGLPAFFLFHPPFVRNVILPMLDAIGAM